MSGYLEPARKLCARRAGQCSKNQCLRRTVSLLVTMCLSFSPALFGQTDSGGAVFCKAKDFDIPRLQAGEALIRYAEQAGVTLIYSFDKMQASVPIH